MTTLPIHQLPAARMSRLTEQAAKIMAHKARRERFKRWVKRNIVDDDPRSQEEQMLDELSPDRSSLWFTLFVIAGMAALVIGWALIF
jgi:hypothetical protein